MSMIKDLTTTTATTKPPSTSARRGCFLGCFGFKDKKVNSNSRRSKWISKLKFSFKKTKGKTIPVDQTTVTKKSKSEKLYPAKSSTKWEIQVVEDDAKLNTKWADSVKLQNGSFRSRRKETKTTVITSTKAAGANVDLPEKKAVSILTHPLKPLTHVETLPHSERKKPLPASVVKGFPAASGGNKGGLVKQTTPFDSMAGMSIILVTLVIMMLWGKLCAILCTCAWFFIAPRLDERVTVEKRWPELDLESVEYKKKVILEGLLQRNHRNNVVGRL